MLSGLLAPLPFPSPSSDIRLALLHLPTLARILAADEQLVTALLSEGEMQVYSRYSYTKRRLEWLGGRLAAKDALVGLLDPPAAFSFRDLSILPDSHGRPVLHAALTRALSYGLSISHSHDYAAALICRNAACGVDIQACSERLQMVRERFAAVAEIQLFAASVPDLDRLAILWSAKEAVKKCCFGDQPTFFGRMEARGVCERGHALWDVAFRLEADDRTRIGVQVAQLDHYFLAWVIGGDHA
jgi:phosphopantetheinyl transferase (holo-ACP synthase)